MRPQFTLQPARSSDALISSGCADGRGQYVCTHRHSFDLLGALLGGRLVRYPVARAARIRREHEEAFAARPAFQGLSARSLKTRKPCEHDATEAARSAVERRSARRPFNIPDRIL